MLKIYFIFCAFALLLICFEFSVCVTVNHLLIYSLSGEETKSVPINRNHTILTNLTQTIIPYQMTVEFDYIFEKQLIISVNNYKDFWISSLNKKFNKELVQTTYHIKSIAIDWINELIYFNHINIIYVMLVNKPRMRYIVSKEGDFNSDIAVNPIESFIIWSKPSEILKASQDGSQTQVIVKHDVKPQSLAIDFELKRIYYIDILYTYLWSLNYDGSDQKLLLKSEFLATISHSIDIFGSAVYWAVNNAIYRTSRSDFNSSDIFQVMSSQKKINAFKLFNSHRQPNGTNACRLAKCSHICLPINTNKYRCVCPLEQHLLPGDKCDSSEETIEEEALIIMSLDKQISSAPLKYLDTGNSQTENLLDITKLLFNVDYWIKSIDYSIERKILIWAKSYDPNDSEDTSIFDASLNQSVSSEPHLLLKTNLGPTGSISYDWVHDLLYYNSHESITVINIDKPLIRYLIIDKRYSIKLITVNPIDNFIIWSETNETLDTDMIVKANQDGSNEIVLIDQNINNVEAMAIDFISETILWIDNLLYTLTSNDYFGNNRKIVYQSKDLFENAFALDVFGGYIYFNNHFSKTILKVDVNGNDVSDLNRNEIDYISNNRINTIKILHSYRQPNGTNRCLDNKCKHLCLPIDFKSYHCVCPQFERFLVEEEENDCDQSVHQFLTTKELMLTTSSSNSTTLIIIISSLLLIIIIGVMIIIIVVIRNKRKLTTEENIYQDIKEEIFNDYHEIPEENEFYDQIKYEDINPHYDDSTVVIVHKPYTEILPPLIESCDGYIKPDVKPNKYIVMK